MKCVITAGPSAGKTSTMRELSARGYTTTPEAARIVIDQAVSEGKDVEAFRNDQPRFQHRVESMDLRISSNTDTKTQIVFMDRALADNIAYRMFHGLDVYPGMRDACRNEYDYVFRLDQLPYEDDYARVEDEQDSAEIHSLLKQVYEDLGHEVIDVPVVPVRERADMIEDIVQGDR